MSRLAVALAAALAFATACKGSSSSPDLRLHQPASAAVFRGYTDRVPTQAHPYVAFASSGADELALLDAVSDEAVASVIAIRPLSIPVPDPRPALVASAQLGDDAGQPRSDLLVAVSAGSSSLQLVRTWAVNGVPAPGVVDDLHVDLGGPVQALLAVPAVDAAGARVKGEAWVIAAVAPTSGEGSDLKVVRYQRAPTASDLDAIAPVSLTPSTQHLAFEVRALGNDPSGVNQAERWLYAATSDPIPGPGGALGVAELNLSFGPGAFQVRALELGVGTALVAGFTLAERNVDQSGSYDQITDLPDDATEAKACEFTAGAYLDLGSCPRAGFPHATLADRHRRVYADLDEQQCGPRTPFPCGIAVVDPEKAAPLPSYGHLRENPFAGASQDDKSKRIQRQHDDAAEPFLPPVAVPSRPLALVVVPPPANPPYSDHTYQRAPFMTLAPLARTLLTTGVLAIPAANGRVYLMDLGRWELASDTYALRAATAVSPYGYGLGATAVPQIGFYSWSGTSKADGVWTLHSDRTGALAALVIDPRQLFGPDDKPVPVPATTLGYTPDESWEIRYQGFLPGLDIARPAEVEALDDAAPGSGLRVALQARTPSGGFTQLLRVADPTYGIRLGDIVQLWTLGQKVGDGALAGCPDTALSTDTNPIEPFEGKVLEISPPDAQHPGGSLVLGKPEPRTFLDGANTPDDRTAPDYWAGTNGKPSCTVALATLGPKGAPTTTTVRVRARGWDDADPADPKHKEFVVVGASLGYVGRAVENLSADEASGKNGATPKDFVLQTQPEATLACPLIPWPGDGVAVACDAACRARCEQLAVARKARRIWNVSVRCSVNEAACNTAYPMFDASEPSADKLSQVLVPGRVLQPTGPVIVFRLGIDSANKNDRKLVRDTLVRFSTRSGFSPSTRYGSVVSGGVGVGPTSGVAFDRSADTSWDKASDGPRLYVPYVDGTVLDTSPSYDNGSSKVMR